MVLLLFLLMLFVFVAATVCCCCCSVLGFVAVFVVVALADGDDRNQANTPVVVSNTTHLAGNCSERHFLAPSDRRP